MLASSADRALDVPYFASDPQTALLSEGGTVHAQLLQSYILDAVRRAHLHQARQRSPWPLFWPVAASYSFRASSALTPVRDIALNR